MLANNPLVSVVMCTYNHEAYIVQAMGGVLSQKTSFSIELIIGEDCSTDKTRQLVSDYARDYPNIIVTQFPDTNQGSTDNLLSLIKVAKGKYIAICDGDDYWTDPFKLQKQVDFIENDNSFGMVCGPASMYSQEKGEMIGLLGDAKAESYVTLIKGHDDVAAPSMLMNADLLRKCIKDCEHFIRKNLFFDTAISYWFAYHSKIKFLDEVSSVYRVLSNSGCHTTDYDKRLTIDMNYLYIKMYFLLKYPIKENKNVEEVLDALFNYNKQIVKFAIYKGDDNVRKTISFKIGNMISKPFKKIIGIFKK